VRWLNELIDTERRGDEPKLGEDPSARNDTERRGDEPSRPESVRVHPATGNDKE
jgi:hypothetical protein